MVSNDMPLYDNPGYNKMKSHAICICDVKSSNTLGKIVYKNTGGRLALIHADLLFTSFTGPDEIWIANAKLYQLASQLT